MIVNRFLPFSGFVAINLFGLILVRRGETFTSEDLRHEHIHTRQMRELLFLPFYLLYIIEWLVRLLQTRNALRAYRNISFEREAYEHQADPAYLARRRHFAWWRYLRR